MIKLRLSMGWAFTFRVALILCLALFYLTTVRAGHGWGDDFALYIRHAQNLVTGRAYADTGYIYNPAYPELSPRVYPPILPLLLAPAYAVFGLNLTLLKLIPIFTLIIALCVIELALRSTIAWPGRLAVIALTGFNPFFWEYKDTIASEFPFLLFVVVSLGLIHRAYRQTRPLGWRAILGISLMLYLTYGTRSIGLVLIPSLWLYESFFARPTGRLAWRVTAFFGVLAIFQAWRVPGGSSYFDQLYVTPGGIVNNTISLIKALADFVDNGYSNTAQVLLFVLVSGLASVGAWRRWRQGLTIWDVAAGFYALVMTLWPEAYWGRRFLLPLVPLYFFYTIVGSQWLAQRWPRYRIGPRLITALIGLAYLVRYTQADFGPLRAGLADPDTLALFAHIQQHTPAAAIFIFQKPRALALYTHRSASAYAEEASDSTLWQYFNAIHATHVIVAREFEEDLKVLAPFVARQTQGLELIYANADFQMYRIVAGSP